MRFRTKMIICVIMLLSLAFMIGGSILISMSFRTTLSNEKENGLRSYQMILYTLDAVNHASMPNYNAELMQTMRELDSQNGRSWEAVTLNRGSENIYSSSAFAPFQTGDLLETDAAEYKFRVFQNQNTHYLQISGAFMVGAESVYRLGVLYDISAIYTARADQVELYRWVFIVVLLFGLLAAWLLSGWLTKPLRRLSQTARQIASGDLSCRADVQTRDEIGGLARDFNDMTDQLEANIEELKDGMRRQEEFMGSFAHELKTPMTAIIGYADLLRGQMLTPDEKQEASNYIFSEGRRLESLSLKLLDLLVLKRQDFELTPCRPKHILQEVVRGIQPLLDESGIRIRCIAEDGVCRLEPDLFKSLLFNVIDNARKAIDGGGEIRVRIAIKPDGCLIQAADTGRGMAEEELKKITEAFYRVDKSRSRAQGGVGLGLAICSEIVRLHKGDMQFVSKPGQGTCVTIRLRGGGADA